MADKMNITITENLSGLTLKCPKCDRQFNPGAIDLVMAFEDLDGGSTEKAPPYICHKCGETSSVREWYQSTLTIR